MAHDQLYYPNINPRLSTKFCISLLHWDHVMRILPKEGTAELRSPGILHELESENILVSEHLEYRDIDRASEWLKKLITIAREPNNPQYNAAKSLISLYTDREDRYYIYEGKANHYFPTEYPEYFSEGYDSTGNRVFYCSRETGLVYMTLLSFFLNKRKNFANTITDQPDAFPFFIVLNKFFNLSKDANDVNFEPIVEAAGHLENIFFVPLLKVLEPKNFRGATTIERIIAFRKDSENEKLRQDYLKRIDNFLDEFNTCQTEEDAKEIAHDHEKKFRGSLKILISACKEKGIPVNEKIVSHGKKSVWETAGRFWDNTSRVIDLVTKNYLAIFKPLLRTKPSIDFYNNVLKNSNDFYPLLIQENFNPTGAQKAFARIRELDKIDISPYPEYSPLV